MSIKSNLENLLAKGQDNALLRFGLGSAYSQEKNFEKAAEHFKKAIEFNREYTAAWKLYGRALVILKKDDEAIKIYQQGIKIAEEKGDKQAEREMQVFLKRLLK